MRRLEAEVGVKKGKNGRWVHGIVLLALPTRDVVYASEEAMTKWKRDRMKTDKYSSTTLFAFVKDTQDRSSNENSESTENDSGREDQDQDSENSESEKESRVVFDTVCGFGLGGGSEVMSINDGVTVSDAVGIWLASYYVFHLCYPSGTAQVLGLLQEILLGERFKRPRGSAPSTSCLDKIKQYSKELHEKEQSNKESEK